MKKLIIILLVIVANNLFATDYYVSLSEGDDNNNGTSQDSPWKTLGKVMSISFNPGDIIHFKRGDTWTKKTLRIDEIGNADNPIIFTDYGTGELPTINVVDTFPKVSQDAYPWTDEGNNIWSIFIDADFISWYGMYWTQYSRLRRMKIDGVEVLGATPSRTSELGKDIPDKVRFHYDYKATVDKYKLSVYSTTNPNNLTIEFPFLYYGVEFRSYAKHVIFENFKVIGGDVCAVTVWGSNITIRNIDVGDMCNHAIDVLTPATNVIVDNCILNSNYSFDYSQAGIDDYASNKGPREGFYIRGADSIVFKNSKVYNFTHANINIGRYSTSDPSENCKIHDNYTTSDLAYGGRTVTESGTLYLEYYNNFIDGAGVQNQINGQYNHFHHNIIKGVRSTPLKRYHAGYAISLFPYTNDEDIKGNIFENNIFIDCESGAIDMHDYQNAKVTGNIFRNNILVDNGKQVDHLLYEGNRTSNINLAIKIWGYFSGGFITEPEDNNFQNNFIYYTNGNDARILYHLNDDDFNGITTPSLSITEFNAQNGVNNYNDTITDNFAGDPLFIDAANDDYHLNENSPAINAGITPLAITDRDGNAIPYPGTLPDVGIYEFQGVSTSVNNLSSNDFFIYPSPFRETIFVSTNTYKGIKQVAIYNLSGKLMFSEKYKINSAQNIEIKVPRLKTGSYIVKVLTYTNQSYSNILVAN